MFPEVEASRVRSFGDDKREREAPMARWCGEVTNSVKVDLGASNICSSDRNHAEEPVFPPPEQSDSLVQHEKVMQPLGDIGRHREEFTWGYRSGCVPHCVMIFNKRTDEMSTLFDNPSSGTMEPVVVTRVDAHRIRCPDTIARVRAPYPVFNVHRDRKDREERRSDNSASSGEFTSKLKRSCT